MESAHDAETNREGLARYTQKFYRENNVIMKEETRGTKAEMHTWQHEQILKHIKEQGVRPPMNRSNW
jgi:hypothetical protein